MAAGRPLRSLAVYCHVSGDAEAPACLDFKLDVERDLADSGPVEQAMVLPVTVPHGSLCLYWKYRSAGAPDTQHTYI